MRFYYVKDAYIEYLRKYDSKVATNKEETRPYVGVVLEIGKMKYYAPFTSPKPKHKKMKNGKDFRKINHGKYGAINFNNMIPVIDETLIKIDIDGIQDEKYKNLLKNQFSAIQADRRQIEKTAKKLYELIMTEDAKLNQHDQHIKERCCNLAELERIYKNYKVGNKEENGENI